MGSSSPFEQALACVLYLADLAVHLFWGADHIGPCRLADRLVAQADAEQGEGGCEGRPGDF